MPKILEMGRYVIYFWSNENDEPLHIHIGIKRPHANDAKMWVLRNGDTVLVHNKNDIPKKDLKKTQEVIKDNVFLIITEWKNRFGRIDFHNKFEVIEKDKLK